MALPKKICSICSEEFELRPGKPGYANRCPACSEEENTEDNTAKTEQRSDSELIDARKKAMRDLLYRKDS